MKEKNINKINNLLLATALIFISIISIGHAALNSNLLISGDVAYVYTTKILYEQVKLDARTSGKYAKKYTGDTSTFSGSHDVYYYYGAAKNNNVIFADYCWKIVRTTDTGGVKILYNGVPISGGCRNTGSSSLLTKEQMNTSSEKVAFNVNNTSLSDVGYMFNKRYPLKNRTVINTNDLYGKSFTYSNGKYTLVESLKNITSASKLNNYHYTCLNSTGTCEEIYYVYYSYIYSTGDFVFYSIPLKGGKNITNVLNEMLYNDDVNTSNSTIKTAIDYWYKNNMVKYTNYLEDTTWCNDRSLDNENINGWNPNGGDVETYLNFYSYGHKSDLICRNKKDRFTVSGTNGNGALTYPVGLLTHQEQVLAYVEGKSPLATESVYWTMSPYLYDYYSNGYNIGPNGATGGTGVHVINGVRPALSLKEGIKYVYGDGSVENPYIIPQ